LSSQARLNVAEQQRAGSTGRPLGAQGGGPGRIAGIDGLRALAVLWVMVFHADYAFGRGGYLGVDVFFVISGFLITRILLHELERNGTISLLRFFERRARRILPAMLVVIAGTVLACQLLRPDALPTLASDALAALLLMANWHLVLHEVSYFGKFEGHQMLQHLWSLAVEEQFYLVWPLAVLGIAARWGRFGLGLFAGAVAVGSALWMDWLAHSLGFPESMQVDRVYLGTDTHASGLLLGAFLACAEARVVGFGRRISPGIGNAAGASLGVCALAGLAVLLTQVGENHRLLYAEGFVLAAVFGAAAILACVLSPRLGAVLDAWPLKWIGERSYGIYLWHWPVFALTRPGLDLDLSQDQAFALRFLLTLLLAALSYRFVEAPMLAGPSRSRITGLRPRLAVLTLGAAVFSGASVLAVSPHDARLDLGESVAAMPAPASVDAHRNAMRSILQPYNLGLWQGSQHPGILSDPQPDEAQVAPGGATVGPLPASGDWSGFLAYAIASRYDVGISRAGEETRNPSPGFATNQPLSSSAQQYPLPDVASTVGVGWDGRTHATLRQARGNSPAGATQAVDSARHSPDMSRHATDTAQNATHTARHASEVLPGADPGSTVALAQPARAARAGSTWQPVPQHPRSEGEPGTTRPITFFGDSVVLGARALIERSIPGSVVHAEVGWQAADLLRALQRVREAGELHPTVLIHLGTNGYVTEKQLRNLLDQLEDRQLVLVVNSRVPKRWMVANNALMESVVRAYRNVVLIDWFGISDTRAEFFVSDGVHLTPAGMRAFLAAVSADTVMAQAR